METQLNSLETGVEDSEQLNTEEVFTENDRHVILAEGHNYSEEEKIQMLLKNELQVISQQMSGERALDNMFQIHHHLRNVKVESAKTTAINARIVMNGFRLRRKKIILGLRKKRVCQKRKMVNQLRNTCTNYQYEISNGERICCVAR